MFQAKCYKLKGVVILLFRPKKNSDTDICQMIKQLETRSEDVHNPVDYPGPWRILVEDDHVVLNVTQKDGRRLVSFQRTPTQHFSH